MQDRVPGKPGRVLVTLDSGDSYYATLTRADEPEQEGTPLNKLTLLSTETANKLNVNSELGTVSEALAAINTELTAALSVSGWSAAAPFTQTVNVAGLLASDRPMVDVVLSAAAETALAEIKAWSLVGRVDALDGKLTATCFEEVPEANINIQIKVVR